MDDDTWQNALLEAFKAGVMAAALGEAAKAGKAAMQALAEKVIASSRAWIDRISGALRM